MSAPTLLGAAALVACLCSTAAAAPRDSVRPPGTVVAAVAAALRPPYRPLNAVALDLDGDGDDEQAVLYGRPDPRGVARVEGLLLLAPAPDGWRVVAAAAVGGSPFVTASFAPADVPADLDRDGAPEIVVSERLAEPHVAREVLTWWRWAPDRGRLTRLHVLEARYRDDGVPGGRPAVAVDRTLAPLPATDGVVRLAEDVERREGNPPARTTHRLGYRLDAAAGRFVPE